MSVPPPAPPVQQQQQRTQPVITNQPRDFTLPEVMKNKGACPPGLEYLAQLDQIIIKQQIELLELLTGFETNNKYKIFNSMGQQVMFAAEETECFQRQCCRANRGFTVHVTDNNNQEIMRVIREFKCCAGQCGCGNCCAFSDCCAFELVVEAPIGVPVGYVRQMCSPWKPKYGVFDAQHEQIAQIDGPCCICTGPCCGDVEFPVVTLDDGQEVGLCAKQWGGFVMEAFTTADNFNVRFPLDMDVKVKATLIGAILMIDFMYFEQKNNQNQGMY